jgi:2-oxo-4-hydroxy-4-carboxy-5-ureidoimidazoline decarboxylase
VGHAGVTIDEFNGLSPDEARAALERCCGATRWIGRMVAQRPFRDATSMIEAAFSAWAECGPEDWREAFTHHPRLGDVASLREKYASTATWAASEQAGTAAAPDQVLEALAHANHEYEAKYGHIFILCATGKTAAQMLEHLSSRMANAPDDELRIAAGEQEKITRLRLEKLLGDA